MSSFLIQLAKNILSTLAIELDKTRANNLGDSYRLSISPLHLNNRGEFISEPPATGGHEWLCCEGCLVCHRLASSIRCAAISD